ncbi:phage regulatory CII family protein [Pseudomonas nitroreducens]|uniref:phage regulatory CII family protein n=1 Tax=Pseudomonas nitroreducens TaxID=46680 RepID=UPI00351D319F
MENFEKAIHDEVIAHGGTDLAKSMGVNRTRLLDCANPNREEHRMNLQMFGLVLAHVPEEGRRRILRALLGEYGYDLVARAVPVAEAPLQALVGLLAEVGDVTRELHDALEDGRITQFEKATLNRSISEVRSAVEVLEQSVKVA